MQGIALNHAFKNSFIVDVGLKLDPKLQANLFQQYIVSPLGASAISYGAIKTNLAILDSKNEADQYFKEQGKLLESLWKDFKRDLYLNNDSVRQDDLDTFYKTLIDVIPPERLIECNRLIEENGHSNFADMPLKEKLRISYEIAYPRPDHPIDYQEKAFDQLQSDVQDRLVNSLLKEFGDDSFYQRYPYIMKYKIGDVIQNSAEKYGKEIEKNGFKFLGYGSIGAVFLCEHKGHKAVMKVTLAPDGSDEAETLKRDREEIEKIRKNSILAINSETGEIQYGPEQRFMPSLLYNESGYYLGNDKVLVAKYYNGKKIHEKDPNSNDDKLRLCSEDYIKRGLDDGFLNEFIEAYTRHASKGSDLFDLSVHNTFYLDGRLQFFETVGFAKQHSLAVADFRVNHPIAALLKALLTDVLLFETKRTPIHKQAVERSVNKYLLGDDRIPKFWDIRYEQMQRGLHQAIEDGVFSREDLMQGIQNLRSYTSQDSQVQLLKNLLTDQGLDYLSRLEDSLCEKSDHK